MTTLVREKGGGGGGKPKKRTWFQDRFEDCMFPVADYLHAKMGELGGGGNQQGGKQITALRRNEEKEDDRRRRYWLLDIRCQIVFFSPDGSIMAERG